MNHFYQNLGKLFFAIAAADKKVTPEEISALKKHVSENWLDLEDSTDYFGSDAAHQIEIVFDYLVDEMPDAEDCYRDFADFRKKHDSIFKQEVKDMIWQTADSIASSFNGKNKSELVMLSRLAQLLGK
ncbi:MAG: TerB family tellurite resistance protein [Crocinitomicaceae bacterium]|nr:TerB family tellurite resistance protein [Crocinitomicaceae bacterium]